MANYNLPADIDATYPDRDAGAALHQQHHDVLHGLANRTPNDGTDVLTATTVPAASETAAGIVELATDAEVAAGTDALRAVTPKTLADNYAGGGAVPAASGIVVQDYSGISQARPTGAIVYWLASLSTLGDPTNATAGDLIYKPDA